MVFVICPYLTYRISNSVELVLAQVFPYSIHSWVFVSTALCDVFNVSLSPLYWSSTAVLSIVAGRPSMFKQKQKSISKSFRLNCNENKNKTTGPSDLQKWWHGTKPSTSNPTHTSIISMSVVSVNLSTLLRSHWERAFVSCLEVGLWNRLYLYDKPDSKCTLSQNFIRLHLLPYGPFTLQTLLR